jgi:hypothetical protein
VNVVKSGFSKGVPCLCEERSSSFRRSNRLAHPRTIYEEALGACTLARFEFWRRTGLSVVLGAWPQWGLWLIVVFLVGVTPQIHNFWAVSDGMQRMGELTNLMKNVALLGAALALLKLAETQPWPLSVSR